MIVKNIAKPRSRSIKRAVMGFKGMDLLLSKKLMVVIPNIVGLPIHEVVELLKELEVSYWNKK